MPQLTRLENATLNARTALALSKGIWRMRGGRPPWRSRRAARRRRR